MQVTLLQAPQDSQSEFVLQAMILLPSLLFTTSCWRGNTSEWLGAARGFSCAVLGRWLSDLAQWSVKSMTSGAVKVTIVGALLSERFMQSGRLC